MNVGNFSETQCLQTITSSSLINKRDLLFAWANNLGVSFIGGESETDLFKKIAAHYGAINVGNCSETDCLRSIAATNGVTSPGSLSSLDCLKVIAVNGGGGAPAILDVTNAQKLALIGISVGQQVRVSDGFVVGGSAVSRVNNFFYESGTFGGKKRYVSARSELYSGDKVVCVWDIGGAFSGTEGWIFRTDDENLGWYASSEAVDEPWLVTVWTGFDQGSAPFPTLTHPALQQYTGGGANDESHWIAV